MTEPTIVNSATPAVISSSTETGAVESKKPPSFLVGFALDGMVFESVVSGGGYFQFAYLKNGTAGKSIAVEMADKHIVPPFSLKGLWECGALHMPSDVWAHSIPTAELLDEIKAFIARYAAVPAEWLELIALYVVMTWVYDRFTAVPYLRFLGEPHTGKTRLLQVAASLCFRSLSIAGNITGAALYRSLDLTRGTLAVDEGDFHK